MYLDSTETLNSIINIMTTLGLTITSHLISYHKDTVFKKHLIIVKSNLADSINNAIILNVDDYHNIHTKKMPNTTTISTAVHLVTILLNPIKNELAILK